METPNASYQYVPLESNNHIRIINLLPGGLDSDIQVEILHTPLPVPEETQTKRLTLKGLEETLSPGWHVRENLEGRFIFTPIEDFAAPPGEIRNTWRHPSPELDPSLYMLPSDKEHWTFEPTFEALSYAWGLPEKSRQVIVRMPSGPEMYHTFIPIGQNLHDALNYLRYPDRSRRLWVDAICINQDDNDEKSHQVRRMSHIYRLARCVVVWLGDNRGTTSDAALRALADLGKQVDFDTRGFVFEAVDRDKPPPPWYQHHKKFQLESSTWVAISELLDRPWFERLWVLQEISLANPSYAVIQCGLHTIPWTLFIRAALSSSRGESSQHPNLLYHLQRVDKARKVSPRFSIPQVFRLSGTFRCFDLRDKVYGILGLVAPRFASQINPNYTIPVENVYRNALLTHLRQIRRWEILPHDSENRIITGPTWVPDLSGHRQVAWDSKCQMSAGLSEVSFLVNGDVLEIAGVQCAKVSWVGERMEDLRTEAEFFPVIRSWWQKLSDRKNSPYVHASQENLIRPGDSMRDAFIHTLIQDTLRERRGDFDSLKFTEWERGFEDAGLFGDAGCDEPSLPLDFSRLHGQYFRAFCHRRRFMLTDEGYMGLVPNCVSPGDIIAVFLGCDRPMVLRPQSNGKHYQVMGTSFVHGLQDATALLGPLPKGWHGRFKEHPVSFGRLNYNFGLFDHNHEQAQITRNDPRLESHPDWDPIEENELGRELTSDDPEWCEFFRHRKTGEINDYNPQMTPDALRARGVPIKTFCLV